MQILLYVLEKIYLIFRDVAMRLSPLKHYQQDPPGFRPDLFVRVFKKIRPTLIQHTRTHWSVPCVLGNDVRDTNIYLVYPFDPKKPSVTFHHGAGKADHMTAARAILGRDIMSRCNVFVLKAQKHISTYEYLSEAVDSFFHQQQTFAGSVLATEEIVHFHKKHSTMPIVVSGASMGGIVATLHAFLFGSADSYVPIVAYPNVGEIFLGSSYKSGVAGWEKKRHIKEYIESYRMQKSLPRSLVTRVFPVLGRFDTVVPFAQAEAFWKKQGIIPTVFPYGHFTSVIKRREIQKLILAQTVN
jgi:hypothetical protein